MKKDDICKGPKKICNELLSPTVDSDQKQYEKLFKGVTVKKCKSPSLALFFKNFASCSARLPTEGRIETTLIFLTHKDFDVYYYGSYKK